MINKIELIRELFKELDKQAPLLDKYQHVSTENNISRLDSNITFTTTNTYVLYKSPKIKIYLEEEIKEDNTFTYKLTTNKTKKGYYAYYIPDYKSKIVKEKSFDPHKFAEQAEPITNLEYLTKDNIAIIYFGGHLLFDCKGDIVSVPYSFDYIGTPFHSDCIDLEKALPGLKAHPWITYISDIKEVEYYNQNEEGDKRYVCITIYPDQETYSELWEKCLATRTAFPSVRFKEMLHDGYYPTEERNLLGLLEYRKDNYAD